MGILVILALILAVIFIGKGIIIVQQQEAVIIQRLGEYKETLGAGLHFIFPIFEAPRPMLKIVKQRTLDGSIYSTQSYSTRIDLRETVYDFPRQNVITKDNVTISINALLYFQIIDAKRAIYSIENLPEAIEKLTQTNLRNLVGQLALDETLVSRDIINDKLREILDKATDKWGVKVNRVELQDIVPPASIQNAMEKEKKAEQDRRATILEAEGIKKSAVLTAEGEKLAAINKAEGEKQAEILKAEAEKQAEILKAEGIAQARIIQADAEKEAINRIIGALADKGKPDQYLIAMKYLETLSNITSGENNKVVYMPYEATGILSSVDGIKQMFDKQ
ncbi:MAG: SPFH/Band 7/PHB domain protein [Cyanobacteria bacterium SIG29]|nr:SPFH/Band 7/PHB domain protein [Cyanobacteria bacterium SIG29]